MKSGCWSIVSFSAAESAVQGYEGAARIETSRRESATVRRRQVDLQHANDRNQVRRSQHFCGIRYRNELTHDKVNSRLEGEEECPITRGCLSSQWWVASC